MYYITVFIQTFRISSCNLWTKDRSECTVCICYIYFNASLLFLFYSRKKFFYQNFFIQCLFKFKVKDFLRIEGHRCLCAFIRIIQNLLQIQCGCTFWCWHILHLQKICSSYQFIQCTDTEFCHIFTKFLCDKAHEVHNIFRFSAETLSKFRILCCNSDRAGIQITYTHHYTSHCYQRCGSKSEFFCSKDGCDRHVTAAHQLTVCLDADSFSQTILDQRLMCLGKSKLPWKSGIVNRTSWCRTGSSVISGDQYQSGSCFGNTGCYGTNAGFWYQFHRNPCIFIRILAVINELCKVLDGIDIMMWRWRDQTDSRCRMTGLGNPWIYLSSRQMSAFSWFCSLCHLDLDFLCTYQISGSYTESSGSDLLDCGTAVGIQSFNFFSTFTTVGFTM